MGRQYCSNCGSIIHDNSKYCQECGARIGAFIQDDSYYPRKKKKSKAKKVTLVILCLLLVVGGWLYVQGRKYIYHENMTRCIYSMMESASEIEEAGNLIRSVWANSIYKTSDPETDKFTKAYDGEGAFYDEFDDALDDLFSNDAFNLKLNNIATQKQQIAELMRRLSDPPSSYSADYSDLRKLYSCYQEFSSLVLNCSGSLESFSNSFSEADENMLKAFYPLSAFVS